MNKSTLQDRLAGYSGEAEWNVSLAPYTTLKIGGAAEIVAYPKTLEEVRVLLRHQIPYVVLGAGSNMLVRDGGIRDLVIQMRHWDEIAQCDATTLVAGGGVSYPRMAVFAQKHGLSGLEFAAGIPGTVGGAVMMNAGVPDGDTASRLKEVTLVGPGGHVASYKKSEMHFEYRRSGFPKGSVVIRAAFDLTPAPSVSIKAEMARRLAARRQSQPLAYPNVGSIFKNPPGDAAGRLIESVGLKGHRIGDAQISTRHANFMINRGQATARDMLSLIQMAQQWVKFERKIALELEIHVIGEDLC